MKPGRLVLMPTGWPSKLADKINPRRSHRLARIPSDWPNNREERMKPPKRGRPDWRPSDWPDNREDRMKHQRRGRIDWIPSDWPNNSIHLSLHTLIIVYPLVPSYSHHCVFLNQHDLRMLISSYCSPRSVVADLNMLDRHTKGRALPIRAGRNLVGCTTSQKKLPRTRPTPCSTFTAKRQIQC